MPAFAILPSILWSRCLQPLRRHPAALVLGLGLGAAGMLAGILAARFRLGRAWALRIPPAELGMLLAMLAGMLAGLTPALWLRSRALRRWRPQSAPAAAPT